LHHGGPMAISSQTTTVSYTGNASLVTPYPVTFRYDASAWVVVQEIDEDGAVTTLSLGTDYTLTGNGAATTGNVVTGGGAIPATSTLRITRDTALTQTLSLTANSAIPSATIEAQLDKLVMSDLDASRRDSANLARSLRVPDGELAAELPAASTRLGRVPYFNATTGAVETKTPSQIFALSDGAPADGMGLPAAGTAGQILRALGDGAGEWAGIEDLAMDAPEAFRALQGLESCIQLPRMAARLQSTGIINPMILVVGDSVAEGKLYALRDALIAEFGELQTRAYFEHGGTASAGAAAATSYSVWPSSDYFTVPTSGIVTFLANTVSPLRCNQAKVYYIAESGAGTFKLQASYNGGAYADVGATINASNGSTISAVHSVTLPLGLNAIRVVGVSGTVKILPICRYSNTGKVGAGLASITKGGISLADMVTTANAIVHPVILDLAPDVILFDMKETTGVLAANLAAWVTKINGALGYTPDWVFLGSNQIPGDNTVRLADTEFARQYAIDNGYSFIDLGLLFGEDIAQAQARGLHSAGVDVHPTDDGYEAQVAHVMGVLRPALIGSINANTRPTTLVELATPLSLATEWRAAILNGPRLRPVEVAAATFTDSSAGVRTLGSGANGVCNLDLYFNSLNNDYARAALSIAVNSGRGTGAGTRYTAPIGFTFRVTRVQRTNTVLRIFIGATGTDQLAGKGIGIQINPDDTAQILAHDGSSLTTGTAFGIGTFTAEMQFIVETDALGNVFGYYCLAGDDMPRTPIAMTTGGPTGTAAIGYDTLCASFLASANQTIASEAKIFQAAIFQGAALIP